MTNPNVQTIINHAPVPGSIASKKQHPTALAEEDFPPIITLIASLEDYLRIIKYRAAVNANPYGALFDLLTKEIAKIKNNNEWQIKKNTNIYANY
jgi:hypothetical protein